MVHEATHQLNNELAQFDLEKWLDEGIADYFGTSQYEDPKSSLLRPFLPVISSHFRPISAAKTWPYPTFSLPIPPNPATCPSESFQRSFYSVRSHI